MDVFTYIPTVGLHKKGHNHNNNLDFINLVMPTEDMEWLKQVKNVLIKYGYAVDEWNEIGLVGNRVSILERYLCPGYAIYSNSETFLTAKMVGSNFELVISLMLWVCEPYPKWELIYSWNYPFQDRMNKILEDWNKCIVCKAYDGEGYRGALLGGYDSLPFIIGSLHYICCELPEEIKEIANELDRRLL